MSKPKASVPWAAAAWRQRNPVGERKMSKTVVGDWLHVNANISSLNVRSVDGTIAHVDTVACDGCGYLLCSCDRFTHSPNGATECSAARSNRIDYPLVKTENPPTPEPSAESLRNNLQSDVAHGEENAIFEGRPLRVGDRFKPNGTAASAFLLKGLVIQEVGPRGYRLKYESPPGRGCWWSFEDIEQQLTRAS